jgi:hypothetical protein
LAKKENQQLDEHTDLVEEILLERDGVQYRMCVTEFRGSNYLSIREWYLDFEEIWMPSKNGFTMPYNIASVAVMFSTLTAMLSKAENLEIVLRYCDESRLETIPDPGE